MNNRPDIPNYFENYQALTERGKMLHHADLEFAPTLDILKAEGLEAHTHTSWDGRVVLTTMPSRRARRAARVKAAAALLSAAEEKRARKAAKIAARS